MSIVLWITIEMEYKIKCLKFLFFTNGRQKLTTKGLTNLIVWLFPAKIQNPYMGDRAILFWNCTGLLEIARVHLKLHGVNF